MTPEEEAAVETMGKKGGHVIIKDRRQPVSGVGRLLRKAAAAEVEAGIPYVFNVSHFTDARKKLKVRPETGAKNPEHTNADWCEYDEPTRTYRYTRAFVKLLAKKCSTESGFTELTGRAPTIKSEPEQES